MCGGSTHRFGNTIYCLFKGHTACFPLGEIQDIACNYEQLIEVMEGMTGRVALY
jgi:hypothetical protein